MEFKYEGNFFGFWCQGWLSRYVLHSQPSLFTSLVRNTGSMDGGVGCRYKPDFCNKSVCIATTDSDQVQVLSHSVSLLDN
jgi:hypothetical protein